MTDIVGATPPSTPQDRDFELAKMRIQASSQYVGRMIWLITLISGAISVIVVVSVVLISLSGIIVRNQEVKVPDVLSNWGGIILGFYFGQFVNLVKDFMGFVGGGGSPSMVAQASPSSTAASPPPSAPSSSN
jgi:hypothetical protein